MKKAELKNKIFNRLSDFFSGKNFGSVKAFDRFERKVDFGFQSVSFHIVQRNSYYEVSFSFGIRFDDLENVARKVIRMDPKLEKKAISLLVTQNNLPELNKSSYRVQTVQDLHDCLSTFTSYDFVRAEMFFFDKFVSLESVDQTLNLLPTNANVFLNNPEKQYFKGLIVAHLVQSEKLIELKDEYSKKVSKMNLEIQARFNFLTDILNLN